MKTTLCASALQMAFWRRKPKPGLPHHSDRVSQYVSHEYRKHLSIMKMGQSVRFYLTITPIKAWLKGLDFPVLLSRQVFTNKDGSTGILYLACSDLDCDPAAIEAIYQKWWKVEVFHKTLKSIRPWQSRRPSESGRKATMCSCPSMPHSGWSACRSSTNSTISH
jgi:hypothetical protein